MSRSREDLKNLTAEEKRNLLADLLRRQKSAVTPFPLSYGQRGFWFLSQLEEFAHSYLTGSAWEISGPLDAEVLRQALERLLQRHQMLRASFEVRDGTVFQRCLESPQLEFQVLNLTDREPEDLGEIVQAEHDRPMNLIQQPPVRASLMRVSDGKSILLLSIHHLVTDWWSQTILAKELTTLYSALASGTAPDLGPPGGSYRDFQRLQRQYLGSSDGTAALEFWRSVVSGCEPMDLEFARPGARSQSAGEGWVEFALNPDASSALAELSTTHGVTLFSTLLAGYMALLYRYTGNDAILIGVPMAGRTSPEFMNTVGLFMNMVLLRGDVNASLTFSELLTQVRKNLDAADRHQALPFSYLMENLGLSRHSPRMPLVQTSFNFLSMKGSQELIESQVPGGASGDTVWKTFPVTQQEGQIDFGLEAIDTTDGLRCRFKFDRAMFDEAFFSGMADHFMYLLSSLSSNLECAVGRLPLLSDAERERVLRTWNATETERDKEQCVDEIISGRLAGTNSNIAVDDGTTAFTYAELDKRANQLANLLIAKGVKPGSRVGISVSRSAPMLAALLGIWKAGAAYVPLDPGFPEDRLSFMADDADLVMLLTESHFQALFHQQQVKLIDLNQAWGELDRWPDDRPQVARAATDLAYIIYTSGSTGRPKGVCVSHQAVSNFLFSMVARPGLVPTDRLLAVTTLSFDIAVLELYGPLLVGGRVVMADSSHSVDGSQLAQVLAEQEITVMQATPATWRLLIASEWSGQKNLRVLCGGEALPLSLARQLCDMTSEVWNLYGPTETTVWSTCARIDAQAERVLIGKPIDNTRIYILDFNFEPSPIGVPGELCIGGDGLAQGYWQRDALTAERFVDDPFLPGELIYRTGDQARWLPTGELECLGRMDTQVKVRGYRIELGEIEAVMLEHCSVREAVAVVLDYGESDQRLVAFLVSEGVGADPDDIRALLSRRLPAYMVPGLILPVDAIPLTPNKKVDRRALAKQAEAGGARPEFVPARNVDEETLAEIWAAVLGQEQVGILDNFFDLGGHSLLLVKMITRVNESLGVSVSVQDAFDAQTVAALAVRVMELRGVTGKDLPPLEPVSRDLPLRLSFGQQRLWFLDQLEGDHAAFNLSGAVRLRGELDEDALSLSLEAIVKRHEVLRTTFVRGEDGQPVQVIAPQGEVELKRRDLSGVAAQEREAALQGEMAAEGEKRFDLSRDVMLRTTLYRLGEQDHVLAFTLHHIAGDGWTFGILSRDLGALYGAFASGEASPLKPLKVQYADYAHWQREWLQGEVLEEQLSYWREALGGEPPVVQLPTDRPRPATQTFRGARQSYRLDADLLLRLEDFSRAQGVTLFMTLTAGLKALFARYSGQTQITIGTPVANRTRLETEDLAGLFVNSLVLSTDLDGDPSFEELVSRVRSVSVGAFAHQDLPFEQLVEVLRPKRDLSRHPLFQVMFALQNAPFDPLRLPELELSPVQVEHGASQFDLTLFAWEVDGGLEMSAEYNTDLFDSETIERMLGHYETLLGDAVLDSQRRLSELALLTDAERRQLESWNATASDYDREATLAELVSRQARRSPDAVAAIFEDRSLSYGELDASSNRLARHLRTLGVGPDVLVGVCLERSLDLVVGLLGILKAGGVYMPLDPTFPAERLAFMLTDARVAVLVTEEGLGDTLPPHDAEVVSLDGDREQLSGLDGSALAPSAGPQDLAYVIYTSGSTGQPKGVQIPHQAVVNFLGSMQREPGLDAEDVLVSVTTLSFDISVLEIFLPLTVGARLVLAGRDEAGDGEALRTLLEKAGATVMQATPATWRLLLDAGWTGDGLKVMCGGEAWSRELADALLAGCGSVWNMYGPTETTIWSAVSQVAAGAGPVLIGGPIANTRLGVLDRQLQPLPIGVPGELCIGGDGLARGYLQRPELTEERFVNDPLSGERLYRTGDLVRYRPDGSIEFLGRLDHQVKIRGFRVELGEIEAVMGNHPAVDQVVVMAREDVPGDQRLVAYLVAGQGATPSISELRRFARSRLPDYMVPSLFVSLDEFPLTPNNKVDRKALPSPDAGERTVDVDYRAPVLAEEKAIAAIWAEVLGSAQVGLDDNFFELGGHSLLATQVVARVREQLDVELPLKALFESGTVAALAERVDALRRQAFPDLPPLEPVSRDLPLRLSFGQQRLWFLDQLEGDHAAFNLSGAVRLRGELDEDALSLSLEAIVKRHEVLRTTFVRGEDGQPVQVIAPQGEVELKRRDLSGVAAQEREAALQGEMAAEGEKRFDLSRDVMLRTTLYRLGEQDHVLAFTLHHIAGDGWTFGILSRDLGALYGAFASGEASPLKPLKVQYADYAHWQREWLQGEVLEEQLSYWREALGGEPPVVQLPTDRPRPATQTFRGARQSYRLDADLLLRLEDFSRAQGVTLFMTLTAGLKALFARYSGQTQITIGTPVANRTRLETEDLAGLFVNSLVLSTDLDGDPSFEELVSRVRSVSVGAFAHQDLPFEQLVEVLRPKRDLSRHPLFQVMFALQNAPFDPLRLPELELSPVQVEHGASQFDLTLFAWEVDGGLEMSAEYNTDLFDSETIERMLGHYETLLGDAVLDSQRRLSELALLTDAERRQLESWNATASDYDREATLAELVSRQARRSPDAVAAIFEDRSLSYGELDASSNRLARHLRTLGVGPDVLVGVCLERSLDLVVGLLGILKAGGVYMPLDPTFPAERLAFMLTDARVAVLVTEEGLGDTLPPHDAEVVSLDGDREQLSGLDGSALAPSAGPQDLAYVIYTSGSTGQPKGVQIPHQAVVNFLGSMQREPGLDAEDVLVSVTTLSFDISVLEIFLPLTVGARLVLAGRDEAGDGEALRTLLEKAGATVMQATPATWRLLLDAGWTGDGLKVMCGGEAWSRELADALLAGCGSVWNMYGPTETTIWSAVSQVAAGAGPVLIGGPIANTRLGVLDRQLQPLPIGVPGELCIGGDGLARGYLQRPELTEERFVNDPLSGERLYRTGDLVRYRPDGSIEFLGRLDHQVKIRGFRVELGEIEAVMGNHPAVDQVVVMAREDVPGDQRLVAYLVAGQGATPSISELRRFARSRLPDYMVPSLFVSLDEFPLTPNNKVDRKALPSPYGQYNERASVVPPRSAMEKELAEIWQGFLQIERVSVYDNFFDLGGHSLLSISVLSRMEETHGIRINPGELIVNNLAQVAELCEKMIKDKGETIKTEPEPPPAPDGFVARVLSRVAGLLGQSDGSS